MASSADSACSQQKTKKAKIEVEEKDKINELPGETQRIILSLLPFKDAVKTSILSRSWANLWESAVTKLDFDETNLSTKRRTQFREWIKRFVARQQRNDDASSPIPPQQLKKFRVSFELASQCCSNGDVDSWVKFALSKRVESLDLSFVSCRYYHQNYVFPCANHIKTPTGLSEIKPLRSLRFSHVDVDDETIQHLISNCPHLEELAVTMSDSLVNLSIPAAAAFALKRLELRDCRLLKSLEIADVPSLTHFTLLGLGYYQRTELRMEKFATLVDLRINIREDDVTFAFISSHAAQLAALAMRVESEGSWFPNVVEFTRLEVLEVETEGGVFSNVIRLIALINACPRLHTLRLSFKRFEQERIILHPNVDRVSRESIRVVEISGFRGCWTDSHFVQYVLGYFVGLERIVVHCNNTAGYVAKQQAREFKSRVSPAIDFVIM
ncbi:unnamed protein product [Linum trigynum]|uniref:F-box domain-containing protein n=1 Tax=Linum trigynum TaxID=586398 RepID=A0AAV2D8Q6_9ROSI